MRKTTNSLIAVACAVVAFAAAGCGTTSTNSGPVEKQNTKAACGGPDGQYTIGMSQANLAEPYRVQMNKDIREAAAKVPQFEVKFADAAQDSSTQVSQVKNFINTKVDLLMISPNEAAPLTEVVREAYTKDIPVIVLDRKVNGDAYTTFVGADNTEIGRKAGEYFADRLLPRGGKIVELKGLSGSTPAAERSKGFRQGIKGAGIDIIASADAEWLRAKAQTKMDAMLKSHPRIDAVYSQNDPMAEGAYLAAEAAGRAKDIAFVGIDGLPIPSGGIKSVTQGRLNATFVYPTGGTEAVAAAKKILVSCEPVPKKQTLPTKLVTEENAAEVYATMNQS